MFLFMKRRESKWVHHKSENDVRAYHSRLWEWGIWFGVPSDIELNEGEIHNRVYVKPLKRPPGFQVNFCTILALQLRR